MAAPRLAQHLSALKRRRKLAATENRKRAPRKLHLESLEDRRLMAVGPTLVAVVPNSGVFLRNSDTLNVAPRELTFRFAQGNAIDPATLQTGIIVKSGGPDRILGNPLTGANAADDVTITPGFLNLGDTPREVIMRFASNLPDNVYSVTLVGGGLTPLKDTAGNPFNSGSTTVPPNPDLTLQFNLDLGAKVSAIVPQPITRNGNALTQSLNTIDVYFDQRMMVQSADSGNITRPSYYRLIDATTGAITLPTSISYTEDATLAFGASGAATLSYNGVPALSPLTITNQSSRLAITNAGVGNAGTFTLTVNGATTPPIAAFGVTAPIILNALNTLPGLSGNVTVTAAGVGQFDLLFQGALAGKSVPVLLGLNGTGTAGTLTTTATASNLPATGGVGASASVLNHLNSIPALSGKVAVSGPLGGPYQLQFIGSLAGTNVLPIVSSSVIATISTQPKATLTFGTATATTISAGTFKLEIGTSPEPRTVETIGNAQHVGNSMSAALQAFLGDSLVSGASPANDVDLYRFDLQTAVTDMNVSVKPTSGSSFDSLVRIFDASGAPLQTINNGGAGAEDSATGIALAAGTYYVGVSATGNSAYDAKTGGGAVNGGTSGGYSLLVTFTDLPAATDDTYVGPGDAGNINNSSFDTATSVGVLGTAGRTLAGGIVPNPDPLQAYFINLPGSGDAPGTRQIPYLGESYLQTPVGSAPDPSQGVETITYSFQSFYGYTPQGVPLFNAISEDQKQRTREIFEQLSRRTGMQFYEVDPNGDGSVLAELTIVTGDVRAINPNSTGQGIGVSSGRPFVPTSQQGNPNNNLLNHQFVIVNANPTFLPGGTWGSSEYGGQWFLNALDGIVTQIGIGQHQDLPDLSNRTQTGQTEPVFPSSADTLLAQALHRPESNDIDLYKFSVSQAGLFRAETIAERQASSTPAAPNLLNTVLTLYRETTDVSGKKTRTQVARNDDYYGNDSYLELSLAAGTYYVAVTSTGNTEFDPTLLNTGFGGRTQGSYNLAMSLVPETALTSMRDATAVSVDGDSDHAPGGTYDFWFQSNTLRPGNVETTIYVDKASTATNPDGTLQRPYTNLATALSQAASGPRKIVRIVGNDTDGRDVTGKDATGKDIASLADNRPYQVGFRDPALLQPLADGGDFLVPRNVTVMIDAGAMFKMRRSNLNVGTTPQGLVSRAGGAIQVLGTPNLSVRFTSFADDSQGGDTDGPAQGAQGGDFGGIVFRDDSDHERDHLSAPLSAANPLGLVMPVFLNYVNHAALTFGGGKVTVDTVEQQYDPLFMSGARPTLSFNTITTSGHAGMSATPNTFDDDGLNPSIPFAQRRVGPDIHDNSLIGNSLNGLFVQIKTQAGSPLDYVDLTTRWRATDIVYVVQESLVVAGTPGGSVFPGTPSSTAGDAAVTTTLTDGRLRIDPGVIVKLSSRIETKISSQFIAEGTSTLPITFTSLKDDKYGAGGTFDTNNDAGLQAGTSGPAPGQWGGLFFGPSSSASLDHVNILYAGGSVPIEGVFANFNAVGIEQADVRLTNSILKFNAGGGAAPQDDRNGRGRNTDAVIFVRGTQPVILNNVIRDNSISVANTLNATGPAISINTNALDSAKQGDYGRSTGPLDRITKYDDNHGPLIRDNRLSNNTFNAMEVRRETLTTETIWDDTDIAHLLRGEIIAGNLNVYGGVRLQSNPGSSLVVKLQGANAGFTASGTPLDIMDRIGGTVQVLGQPGYPVVLTSLFDDTVSSGFDPSGLPVFDTNNDGIATGTSGGTGTPRSPGPGDWRSISLNQNSNDTNVAQILEIEPAYVGVDGAGDINRTAQKAQFVGALAPNEKSGDDSRRLGYQIDGAIAADNAKDADVYSFTADSGTEVWLDIDRTSHGLDAMLELIDADGNVIASATDTDPGNPIVTQVTPPTVTTLTQGSATDNEIQRVQLTTPSTAAPYVFTLNYSDPNTGRIEKTGPIASTATSANVLAALLALPGSPFVDGDLAVSGAAGGPWTITFQGNFANVDVSQLSSPGSAAGAPGNLPGLNTNFNPAAAGIPVGLAQSFNRDHYNGRDTYSTNAAANVAVATGTITDVRQSPITVPIYGVYPTLVTSPGHGLATGDRVQISGVQGATGANGVYTVTVSSSDLFSLDGTIFNPGAYTGGGTWTKLVQTTRDPIMRVILPKAASGTDLKNSPWFVRVRSQPANFTGETGNTLNAGLSSGHYQLQVRVLQADQKPASTVRFADIRFATNGIEIHGLPSHSPLSGETAESNLANNSSGNDTQAGAQFLGNLLTTDNNAISVGGQIANINDVDWYQFDLNADLTTFYGAGYNTFSTMFDIDYADGLARPDATISVFDAAGALIYVGRNGKSAADQPAPGQGTSATDLSRGSFGQLDPLIGPAQLPAGKTGSRLRTYYVAVSTDRSIPSTLNQTFLPAPSNPIVRLEPVDSIGRIVQEPLDASGGTTAGLADNQYVFVDPTTGVTSTRSTFLDVTNKQTLAAHVVPFNLSDVTLFVSEAGFNGTNQTHLSIVNPSTGVRDMDIGTLDAGNLQVDDLAIRGDGTLWAYESDFTPGNTARAGNLYQVDASSAVMTALGPDNIPQQTAAPPNPPTIQSVNTILHSGVGAMAWGGNSITPTPNSRSQPLYLAVNNFASRSSSLYFANFANGNGNFVQNQPWGRVFGSSLNNPLDLTNSSRATVSTTFGITGLLVTFRDQAFGTAGNGRNINFIEDSALAPGTPPTVQQDPTNPRDVEVRLNPNGVAATVAKSFGPNNSLDLIIGAKTPGTAGNSILVQFLQANLNSTGVPSVAVSGSVISVTLNNRPGSQTTIEQVIAGVQTNFQANALIDVTSNNIGQNAVALSLATQVGVSPFQLLGGRDATTVQDLVTAINTNASLNLIASFTPSTLSGAIIGDEITRLTNSGQVPVTQLTLGGGTGATGFTTGLAFGPDANTLYGVSDTGQFFRVDVDPRFGTSAQNATDAGGNPALIFPPTQVVIPDLNALNFSQPGGTPGVPSFSGLARGPLNLNNGEFANAFFATTDDGKLVALDNTGNPLQVFDRDGNGVADSYSVQLRAVGQGGRLLSNITGLAFSNLDFNLWHPTERRSADPGHEISRFGTTPTLNNGRFQSTDNGSFYFGFEATGQNAALGPYGQLPPGGQASQSTVAGAVSNFTTNASLSGNLANSLVDPNSTFVSTTTQFPIDPNDPAIPLAVGKTLVFTSGPDFQPHQITAYNTLNSTFTVAPPLAAPPAGGDTFSINLATTIQFNGDNTLAATDIYSGKALRFTSGPNLLAPPIVISTYNPATKTFTMASAFPAVPSDGDTFLIQNVNPASTTRFDGSASGGLSNQPNFYVGDVLTFDATTVTAALQGISRTVVGYNGATRTFIVTPPLPVAPADQDTFTIVHNTPIKPEQLPDGGQYGILARNTPYTGSTGLPGAPALPANRTAAELLNNPNIANTYNFPGGAYGKLQSGAFSLRGIQASDLPTFYFDYFLDVEDASSTFLARTMVDSARVFIGVPLPGGGTRWDLVATNNGLLSDPGNFNVTAELPTFLSQQANEFPDNPRQQVQRLFNNTGGWRQARVDLSRYAGLDGLQMRFDFSTAGTVTRSATPNGSINQFEDTYYPANPGNLSSTARLRNNNREGFLVDNFIVGMAGRGEMVTGATPDPTITAAPARQPFHPGFPPPAQVQTGPYQLEIRRGPDYATSQNVTIDTITLVKMFDLREQASPDLRLANPASPTITDGFESGGLNGNPQIIWNSAGQAPWTVITSPVGSGSFGAASGAIGNNQQSVLQTTLVTGDGVVTFTASTQADTGDTLRFYVDGRVATDINGNATQWTGVVPFQTISVPVKAGRHVFRWAYEKDSTPGSAGQAYLDDVSFPSPSIGIADVYSDTTLYRKVDAQTIPQSTLLSRLHVANGSLPNGMLRVGDRNQPRPQGHIQIEQNSIDLAAQSGILVDAGPRDAGSNQPYASVRNLPTLNSEGLVPGVTLANNVVSNPGQAGITFAGDSNAQVGGLDVPIAAVPFGRIVNNTIFGGASPSGTGIAVGVNAGPSLLNNIIANTATGISIDPTSTATTVVGANLFSGNTVNAAPGATTGSNAIILQATDPLFKDPARRNFYLQTGSQAIDSSLNTLADRAGIAAVKSVVGIPQSPILAPDRDLFGQARVDDPSQNPPPGLGQNIFKDRGAVERADFTAPSAFVSDPLDNDSARRDRNSVVNDVAIRNENLERFVIKFADVGIGIDDATVTSSQFELYSDSVKLNDPVTGAVDYTFIYNQATNEAFFVPTSGVWALDHTYKIVVNNTPPGAVDALGAPLPTGVLDLAGNSLMPNRPNGETSFNIFVGTLYDFGDAPDPTFPTLFARSGAVHQVLDGFYLGNKDPNVVHIDEENDAKQTPLADGDLGDDGVQFNVAAGLDSTVIVTATIPPDMVTAKLDAWFDLNHDGVWTTNEKLIDHLSNGTLVDGVNTISFKYGDATALKGPTMARFRFSSTGVDLPTGFGRAGAAVAPDGEVEDYRFIVGGPPYQNPSNELDVNNDGVVTPGDALTVINYINIYRGFVTGNIALPLTSPPFPDPPPILIPAGGGPGLANYVDVNGNGFLDPGDSNAVITFINSRRVVGSGEGEGEGAPLVVAAPASVAAVPVVSDATGIPPVLLAAPDIVIETTQPHAQTTSPFTHSSQASHNSQLSDRDQALLDLQATGNPPGLGLRLGAALKLKVPAGPLDAADWDDLLATLAGEQVGEETNA